MGRGEPGHNCKCSYNRATLIVCSINIVAALFVLRSLYTHLVDSHTTFSYSPDQIRQMQVSNGIRKASEPTKLVELVTRLKKRIAKEESVVELPRHLKVKLIDEILNRLRSLDAATNTTAQRDTVETWRKQKLKEAKKLVRGKILNSTILPEEAEIVVRALSSGWVELEEEIGLWIPVEIVNKEHDDKPDGEEEFEILPGRQLPAECHAELHTDYGGVAVRWGLTHPKESAYDCCMACLDQAKNANLDGKKCNIWVYCPSETGCFSPDIYQHKNQECWLKYSETPKLNFKGTYSESYRDTHPNAPLIVPWVSGVVSV
ncbi:hypothetical protein ABFS82_03G045400 [Erythranthe guttata]|uniref:uncharacterized protein LOC105971290 n=1 Tax=Erythranthe guttata TaxID=4155 RepID=UPI00064D85BD|nr:PREDICTED: uncharacterized protein LOC105971290 [Erythranthe guttata]|eukprot:XP_012851592.1 PREDICTED: uncharacterized protein LOC105971290 [Erythranthe guttata]